MYECAPIALANRSLLDVCCGTGQLAVYFLERGYRVTGLDLSEHMLRYARENAGRHLEITQAKFVQADASDFTMDEQFGLSVSTFDALNHLESELALRKCFQCVYSALVPDGYFIFDLNTRAGLMRWNSMSVSEDEQITLITRGIYDGQSDRATARITGFIRNPDGLYERFEETVFNTVFDLQRVRDALLDTGWRYVHFARSQNLAAPIDEPEREGRAFIVARK
jgi:SAM-dependent methyltransferase